MWIARSVSGSRLVEAASLVVESRSGELVLIDVVMAMNLCELTARNFHSISERFYIPL